MKSSGTGPQGEGNLSRGVSELLTYKQKLKGQEKMKNSSALGWAVMAVPKKLDKAVHTGTEIDA